MPKIHQQTVLRFRKEAVACLIAIFVVFEIIRFQIPHIRLIDVYFFSGRISTCAGSHPR